jgi:hypothetical protein
MDADRFFEVTPPTPAPFRPKKTETIHHRRCNSCNRLFCSHLHEFGKMHRRLRYCTLQAIEAHRRAVAFENDNAIDSILDLLAPLDLWDPEAFLETMDDVTALKRLEKSQ